MVTKRDNQVVRSTGLCSGEAPGVKVPGKQAAGTRGLLEQVANPHAILGVAVSSRPFPRVGKLGPERSRDLPMVKSGWELGQSQAVGSRVHAPDRREEQPVSFQDRKWKEHYVTKGRCSQGKKEKSDKE